MRRSRARAGGRLAAVVALGAAADALDHLFGPPFSDFSHARLSMTELTERLAPDGVHHALVLAVWAVWLITALLVVPSLLRRRGSAGSRAAAHRVVARCGATNAFASAVGGAGTSFGEERDDMMGNSLARDGRDTDPSPRDDLGSAEATIGREDGDGGMAVADGRGERRWWRADEGARARVPRHARSPFAREREKDDEVTRSDPTSGADLRVVTAPAVEAPAGVRVRIPVGTGRAEEVDLLGLLSLALVGEEDDVAEVLCAMVVDVASRGAAREADVVLVGFGEEMHALDGVRAVPGEGDAVRLATLFLERQPADEATPCPADGPAAVVVFVGSQSDDRARRELVRLADDFKHQPRSLAVVVAGPTAETRWRLQVGGGPLQQALVEQATAAEDVEVEKLPPPAPTPLRGDLAVTPQAGSVEVAVLGPVRVAGTPVAFDRRPKLTELVVYLALHPDGATTDSWATALWPDRRMPMSTLSNRLSETRLALGLAGDGFAHLRKTGGRYHLGPEVTTDWDLFRARAGADDPRAWRAALELVRGRPFEGLREAQWTLLEGAVPAIESAVVELACRLGEHLLTTRDPEGAEWAARKAMLACPWDERLYRLVMRAADAAGNRAGVDAALRQLACVLEVDDEPLAVVHPETASLYRCLTARRAAL